MTGAGADAETDRQKENGWRQTEEEARQSISVSFKMDKRMRPNVEREPER